MGELRLDSTPGRGSVFTLYLALEPVDAVPALRPPVERHHVAHPPEDDRQVRIHLPQAAQRLFVGLQDHQALVAVLI